MQSETSNDFINQYAKYFGIDPAILQPETNTIMASAALSRLACAMSPNKKKKKGQEKDFRNRRQGMLFNSSNIDPVINDILEPARSAISAINNQ